jgi:uncharacterized protein YbaR (Trm112 family)
MAATQRAARLIAAKRVCYSAATGGPMAVRQELLDILVCPLCKTPVRLVSNGAGLKCATCHREYPIKDDIPVMLPDEAAVSPE